MQWDTISQSVLVLPCTTAQALCTHSLPLEPPEDEIVCVTTPVGADQLLARVLSSMRRCGILVSCVYG